MKRLYYTSEADVLHHIYLKEDDELSYFSEFHDSIEFIFITQGKVDAFLYDKKYELCEGDIFYADSYEVHRYQKAAENSKVIVCVLSREYFEKFKKIYKDSKFPTVMTDKEKNKKLFSLIKMWKEDLSSSYLKNMGYACLLFSYVVDAYPLVGKKNIEQNNFVKNILEYINLHYTENITLGGISKELGYSIGYCSKVLKSVTGYPFNDYVNLLRLAKVDEYLSDKTRNTTKTQILYECGFNSTVTYYRVRKKFADINGGKE